MASGPVACPPRISADRARTESLPHLPAPCRCAFDTNVHLHYFDPRWGRSVAGTDQWYGIAHWDRTLGHGFQLIQVRHGALPLAPAGLHVEGAAKVGIEPQDVAPQGRRGGSE